MRTRVIYFDLDGVLAAFDETFTRLTGKSYQHDPNMTTEQKDEKWALLDSHPNFFLDLPWVPGARTMLVYTFKHAPHTVGICSAASRRIPQSVGQKQEWCKREIPWMPDSNVVIVNRKRDKVKYVGEGNILVDDFSVNVDQWKEAGGGGIHFQNVIQTMNELQEIIQAPTPAFTRWLNIIKAEIHA